MIRYSSRIFSHFFQDSSNEDIKGDNSALNSRPVPSPGSVGSRSNTPASNISGEYKLKKMTKL